MSLADNIASEYNAKGRIAIDVPEWEKWMDDGRVYYKPFTVQERSKLVPEMEGKGLDFVVSAIVMKCEDKDGNKLFTLADKPKLKRFCEYDVLDRVAGKMLRSVGDEELGEP